MKKMSSLRSAGVSILVDLANSASEAQKPIVASIIYDFFRNRLAMRSDMIYYQPIKI